MGTTLDEIADVADQVADDQREIARQARSMQRDRDRGRPWATILDSQSGPNVIELLRRSTTRLARATAQFGRALAEGLSEEGQSRRQIARHLGVTHQRVSAMLNGSRPSGPGQA